MIFLELPYCLYATNLKRFYPTCFCDFVLIIKGSYFETRKNNLYFTSKGLFFS